MEKKSVKSTQPLPISTSFIGFERISNKKQSFHCCEQSLSSPSHFKLLYSQPKSSSSTMGNSRKLCLLFSERPEMPGLEVDGLLGSTGFHTVQSASRQRAAGSTKTAGKSQHCHRGRCLWPASALSWATQAGEAEGESKTCLAVPLLVVICLLDVWLTSQMPKRLTSLRQTYSRAPQ